jgi:methyl-accepting chemotaxis protein
VITYASDDFVRISGFSKEELIGKPHNIVRHPDVPKEFFEDLWNFLKVGRPWTGVIKNRCKNGNFYWVLANVTPYYENDALVGYMSVRHKATPEQIEAAIKAYQAILDNKGGNLKVQGGKVVKHHRLKRFDPFSKFTVKSRLIFLISLLSLIMLVIGYMGLQGMNKTNLNLYSAYNDRAVTMSLMFKIAELQRENVLLITNSFLDPNSKEVRGNTTAVQQNIEEITRLWNGYKANPLPAEEKRLADSFTANRDIYLQKGLRPVIEALLAKNIALANKIRHD